MGRRKYSEEDLARMTSGVEESCMALYARASEEQRKAGIGWYPVASEEAKLLAQEFEITHKQASFIVAVLSPLTRWAGNIEDAWRVCSDERVRHALPRNEAKALRILAGEDVEEVVNGRKVTSFAWNIFDPLSDAWTTVDSWMGRGFGIDPADIFERAGVYDAVKLGIERAADTLRLLPNALQAICWLVIIDQHERGRVYTYDGNGVF